MLGAVVNVNKKVDIGALFIQSVKSAALTTTEQPFQFLVIGVVTAIAKF
jgi:hypothetical protein